MVPMPPKSDKQTRTRTSIGMDLIRSSITRFTSGGVKRGIGVADRFDSRRYSRVNSGLPPVRRLISRTNVSSNGVSPTVRARSIESDSSRPSRCTHVQDRLMERSACEATCSVAVEPVRIAQTKAMPSWSMCSTDLETIVSEDSSSH